MIADVVVQVWLLIPGIRVISLLLGELRRKRTSIVIKSGILDVRARSRDPLIVKIEGRQDGNIR